MIAKVVNDFLPIGYQEEIISVLENMPWYFRTTIAQFPETLYSDSLTPFEDPHVSDAFAFTHVCYSDNQVQSQYYDYFRQVLRFLELKNNIRIKEIIRVRLRLTTQFPGHQNDMYNPPHVDLMTTEPFQTFVYYPYDSDGDTIIFDKRYENLNQPTVLTKNENLVEVFRNTPKQGTGVLFDGLQYHSGNSPINYKSRCIINYDFTVY